MNQYQIRNRLLQRSSSDSIWDMSRYADVGFTLQNVKQNTFIRGLEETNVSSVNANNNSDMSREDLVKMVFNKDESELTELERMGLDAYYKDKDVDISKYQQQAQEDYELKNSNYFGFVWKRFNQGYNKNAPEFIAQKTKEIFYDKPKDFIINNPVSKIIGDIYNFLNSLMGNWYLVLIGGVFLVIFIKKV